MPPALILLIVLSALLLAAAILPWPIIGRWKRRRAALVASYAAEHGWDYRPSAPDLAKRFGQVPFGVGFSAKVENVLLGTQAGRPVAVFDYHYYYRGTLGPTSGGSRWYTVVAVSLGTGVPDVAINPAGLKYVMFSRHRDLETGDAAFDKAFAVATKTPDFARDVLVPGVREVLLRHLDSAWRFDGDSLLMISPLAIARAPALEEERLADAVRVPDQVPAQVWERLRAFDPREPG
ncbi:MAG TPA: hypothetical protein VNS55_05090 [Nocardioides sp.]|nr:hypothetical protein [Nocardioides sp.]